MRTVPGVSPGRGLLIPHSEVHGKVIFHVMDGFRRYAYARVTVLCFANFTNFYFSNFELQFVQNFVQNEKYDVFMMPGQHKR